MTSVLPGAAPADWVLLRSEGDTAEYHAGTLSIELHGAETEAYLHELSAAAPSVYVSLREGMGEAPYELVLASVSPWVEDFVETHHEEEVFVKRKREKKRIDLVQDGIGDPRIIKTADVYASPSLMRRRVQ